VTIRSFAALAFVPAENVEDAFDILAEAQIGEIEEINEFINYFERTYIRGRRIRGDNITFDEPLFPINTWNKFLTGSSGIARTTNVVEGWNYSLQSLP